MQVVRHDRFPHAVAGRRHGGRAARRMDDRARRSRRTRAGGVRGRDAEGRGGCRDLGRRRRRGTGRRTRSADSGWRRSGAHPRCGGGIVGTVTDAGAGREAGSRAGRPGTHRPRRRDRPARAAHAHVARGAPARAGTGHRSGDTAARTRWRDPSGRRRHRAACSTLREHAAGSLQRPARRDACGHRQCHDARQPGHPALLPWQPDQRGGCAALAAGAQRDRSGG